jgi:hypothetical protein
MTRKGIIYKVSYEIGEAPNMRKVITAWRESKPSLPAGARKVYIKEFHGTYTYNPHNFTCTPFVAAGV